jgi:hypothetical protein
MSLHIKLQNLNQFIVALTINRNTYYKEESDASSQSLGYVNQLNLDWS